MANKIRTLTGGQYATGTAFDNTGTDQFQLYGAGNGIEEDGGNLIVVGGTLSPYGYDTATTIGLGNSSATGAAASKTKITITLDGSGNTVYSAPYTASSDTPGGAGFSLDKSTVSITVTGKGPQSSANPNFSGLNNVVDLDNHLGTTTVSLSGNANLVQLNGDATNSVVAGSGTDSVGIGTAGDALFGFKSTVTLAGSGNVVTGGDENVSVSGGTGDTSVTLGGGNDTVNLGGGGATVILSASGASSPGVANDTVTLAGSNDTLQVNSSANVTVNGTGITGDAVLMLGDGSNSVTLGGTDDLVSVTDSAAMPGTDNVNLGTQSGNTVLLHAAGGTVNATGSGKASATVLQDAAATTGVTVNLGKEVGTVGLGAGSDSVTANGNGSSITLGSSGAPGGNDTVVAGGTGSTATLYSKLASHDSVAIGSLDTVNVTGGAVSIMGTGGGGAGDAKDTFNLYDIQSGSTVDVFGNGDMVFLADNSSAHVVLGGSQTGDTTTVQGNADHSYAGTVEISAFGPGQTLDLQGLNGANGAALNSVTAVAANSASGAGGTTIDLAGGGKIILDGPVSFGPDQLVFS